MKPISLKVIHHYLRSFIERLRFSTNCFRFPMKIRVDILILKFSDIENIIPNLSKTKLRCKNNYYVIRVRFFFGYKLFDCFRAEKISET